MGIGLPLPFLIGGIEVQDRRPKYWNEPRRKRIAFVRPHNKHSERKDNWALAPRNQPQANRHHGRNEQERWDLRQFEARQRFAQLDHNDRIMQLQFEQQRRQLQAPMPPQWAHQQGQGHPFGQPRQQQIHPPHHEQHGQHRPEHGDHHHQEARPHRRESPHDIVAIVSGSDYSSSDDDDGGSSSSDDDRRPRLRRSRSPRAQIITREPKFIKRKETLRIKPAKRYTSRRRSSSSDSDSDENASVLRAFKHALKHKRGRSKSRSRSRPRSGTRPTKVIYEDDDRYYSSDDSFDSYRTPPVRLRLKK